MFIPAVTQATIKTLDDAQQALPVGYSLKGRHPSYSLTGPDSKFVGSFKSLQGAIKAARQHAEGVMMNPANPNGGRLVWFTARCGGPASAVTLNNKTQAGLARAMAVSDAVVWAAEFPNQPYDGSDWDREAFTSWKLTDASGDALSDERTSRVWEAYAAALPTAIAARIKGR